MSDQKPRPVKAQHRPARTGTIYRGVRLAKLSVPSRFTQNQIEKAVEAAIAKNADAIAGRK